MYRNKAMSMKNLDTAEQSVQAVQRYQQSVVVRNICGMMGRICGMFLDKFLFILSLNIRTLCYYICRLRHFENSATDGSIGATGACRSLSQQRNLPNLIASNRMQTCNSSTSAVTSGNMNSTAFRAKPGGEHSSQGISHNTLSKEATRVDRKMKPEDTSLPMIAAVEGGFHTQYLLFMRNNAASASAAVKSAFLLKIQSNCCWDSIRPRILEIISKRCPDNTVYPAVGQLHVDGFLVEILPKADRPEVLPPDVQKKMMSRSLHAVCIRITIDHSVVSSPLCTLGTGLSAFTKLKLKFPSEKPCGNIKPLQSSVQREGSVVPQLTTSCSFGPFTNLPAKTVLSPLTDLQTVTQPTSATVTCGSLETSWLQSVKSTYSKPAMLCSSSSYSADSSTACSTELSLTTTDVIDSKLSLSLETERAGQPVTLVSSPVTKLSATSASNMQSVSSHASENRNLMQLHCSTSVAVFPSLLAPPVKSFSSAFSSFLCTDSSNSERKLKNLILPVKRSKSVKLTGHVMQSAVKDDSDSSHTLKAVPGSLFNIRQNLHVATAGSPAEVIVVEEDDSLPPNTSICQLPVTDADAAISSVHSSSVQLSAASSQSLVSHSSSLGAVQSVDVRSNSTSPDQSMSDISLISQTAAHPISLAADSVTGNSLLHTVPVASLSLNVASSQLASSDRSVLMETNALPTVISSPEYDVEQVTEGQQTKELECSAITGESSLTDCHLTESDFTAKVLVDTDDAALDVHKNHGVCLNSCEELSNDSTVGQKLVDTSQRRCDLECRSVALTGAEEVVSGTPGSASQLSPPPAGVELDCVQSSTTVSEHQQPCRAKEPDTSALLDSIVEIVASDEVHTFCNESSIAVAGLDNSVAAFFISCGATTLNLFIFTIH